MRVELKLPQAGLDFLKQRHGKDWAKYAVDLLMNDYRQQGVEGLGGILTPVVDIDPVGGAPRKRGRPKKEQIVG